MMDNISIEVQKKTIGQQKQHGDELVNKESSEQVCRNKDMLFKHEKSEKLKRSRAEKNSQTSCLSSSLSSCRSKAEYEKNFRRLEESGKLSLKFCRFCLAMTHKTGERDIPAEFLRVYESFFGNKVS